MDIRHFLHPNAWYLLRQKYLNAPASSEPLHSLARQLVSEVCLLVGTERTNRHITQGALSTSTLFIHTPFTTNTPLPDQLHHHNTHHHSTHHRDQGIKTIKVAARPWELPTSCHSPTRLPPHHHHPTDTIRPDPTPPDDGHSTTRNSTTNQAAARPLGTACFLS